MYDFCFGQKHRNKYNKTSEINRIQENSKSEQCQDTLEHVFVSILLQNFFQGLKFYLTEKITSKTVALQSESDCFLRSLISLPVSLVNR